MLSSHHKMSVFGQVTMLSNHQQNVGVRSLRCLSQYSPVTTRCRCLVRSRCSPITSRMLVFGRCGACRNTLQSPRDVGVWSLCCLYRYSPVILSSHQNVGVWSGHDALPSPRDVGVWSLCCLSYVTHQSPVEIGVWSLCFLSRYSPVTRRMSVFGHFVACHMSVTSRYRCLVILFLITILSSHQGNFGVWSLCCLS